MPKPSFSWEALVAAKDKEIARLESAYAANLEKSGVEILPAARRRSRASSASASPTARRSTARQVLIATGGQPVRPHVPGIELAITSNEVFHLERLPEAMMIVGGGYIAVEFACLLQRLGVSVTLVYRGDMILRGFDDDVAPRPDRGHGARRDRDPDARRPRAHRAGRRAQPRRA